MIHSIGTQFLRALFSSFGFRYIWPWGKWSALSHDSYTCQKFPRTQAFPTQRILEKNNFVAAVISANDVLLEELGLLCSCIFRYVLPTVQYQHSLG